VTGSELRVLDAAAVRRWCVAGRDGLAAARGEIDALNVFPVPDGDTGTNLLLTVQAVVDGFPTAEADLGTTCRALADAALRGARGSSGVILSQLFRGMADVLSDCPAAGGAEVQAALCRGAEAAYAAVAEPVEGTVLSVARSAAKAAAQAPPGDLCAVVEAAAAGARSELGRTPSLLPLLAAAGVVDAGGRGLVVLLDALVAVVSGKPAEAPAATTPRVDALAMAREAGSPEFAYEVQYLLHAPDGTVAALRDRLAALGDALVVVGGDGLHHVHVHVNDVGAAIEAGIEAGRPHGIRVTRFADQVMPRGAVDVRAARIVAIAPAGGLATLFRDAGALVVEVGADHELSAAALHQAIASGGADQIVLLPNSRDLRSIADAAASSARDAGRGVTVVPTRSPVQGLAAVAVHDATRRVDDDTVAMSAAAAATRYAEVTHAARDAQTSAGRCRAGDVLGLIDDDVVLIGADVEEVARGVLDRLLVGGGELVTIVVGRDAGAELGADLAGYVTTTAPAVETVVYAGDQPNHPLLIGVE
jgi:DAK2 domain fusion protein YloV